MVPYTVVEYYGTLANFNGSGIGIDQWEKIYLCNGQNGTPDKRGRMPVGVIQGIPGGGALNPVVDPANPGNPNYALYQVAGGNTVTLTTPQIPSHTHVATSTPVEHTHYMYTGEINITDGQTVDPTNNVARARNISDDALNYEIMSSTSSPTLGKSGSASITANVSIGSAGSGQSHNNIPPVLACYYIMYIPS